MRPLNGQLQHKLTNEANGISLEIYGLYINHKEVPQ